MFKKPQNWKGLTVNLILGLLKQCSRVQIFAFMQNESLCIAITFYGINFNITNLGFILTNHFFGNRLTRRF